ncbi:MAG: hypothetical protein ACI8X5_000687 [Planctomycetota bacterium]|jgi:hypothetical protein
MLLKTLLTCLLALSVTTPTPAVAQGTEQSDDLVVEFYSPKTASVDVLFRAAQRVISGVAADGQFTGSPTLQTYGELILLQSRMADLSRVVAILKRLDENYQKAGKAKPMGMVDWQYRPHHVSIDSVKSGLRHLDITNIRTNKAAFQDAGSGLHGLEISYIMETGLVLMRGHTAEIDLAKAILKTMDVQQPKLMLTCYFVQGTSGESSASLPKELVEGLSALVPSEGFEMLSMGLLPSDASRAVQFSVDLDRNQGSFELELDPGSFDPESGELSFKSIDFEMQLMTQSPQQKKVGSLGSAARRSFRTSAIVKPEQYTVLGAVGANPVFVVVKLTLMK